MITREHARILRKKIEELAQPMTDADAFAVPELFPMWKVEHEYQTGDRVQYEAKLYKCLQSHTSQTDWTPDKAVSLWVAVPDPAIEWPEWVQPQGAHDAYMTGEKVSHNEKHWICTMDYCTYEPGVYGWDEV